MCNKIVLIKNKNKKINKELIRYNNNNNNIK